VTAILLLIAVVWIGLCLITVGGSLADLATESRRIRLALEAQNRHYGIPPAVSDEKEQDGPVR
jgi:hypothetical protein